MRDACFMRLGANPVAKLEVVGNPVSRELR
jgi:hypothetical protein